MATQNSGFPHHPRTNLSTVYVPPMEKFLFVQLKVALDWE